MAPLMVSVTATVKNEESFIGRLLDSLLAQTQRPEEIIIVDGGSTDRTVEIIESYISQGAAIRLILLPGANIAQGRNAAIRQAGGEIIASTDAGVWLAPHWLEELTRPFLAGGGVAVASGFFAPDPQSTFEKALGATILPALQDINPASLLPSSRSVAFTKAAWEAVGGYPEGLDYCEDVVFDLALRRAGYRFAFAPQALAYFRPRRNLRDFFGQYYRYARGDGKANLWPWRHAIRYASYTLAPLVLLAGFWYKLAWLGLALGAGAYLYHPYRRLGPLLAGTPWGEKIRALAWVPVLRLVGDGAKMLGYPVGVYWRLRRRKALVGHRSLPPRGPRALGPDSPPRR